MAKLHKVNKNGTLSIILPKDVTDRYWGEGDEVTVEGIGQDSIIACRNKQEQKSLEFCLDMLEGICRQIKVKTTYEDFFEYLENVKKFSTEEMKLAKEIYSDDSRLRNVLKQQLIDVVQKL